MEPCLFINNANEILKHHSFQTPAQFWDLKPVNAEVQDYPDTYFYSRRCQQFSYWANGCRYQTMTSQK